jgi:hypothetical protein
MSREASAITVFNSNSFTAARAIFALNAAVGTFCDRPMPDPPTSSCTTDSIGDPSTVFGVQHKGECCDKIGAIIQAAAPSDVFEHPKPVPGPP